MRKFFAAIYRVLGSFGLACIILLLMMVLTLFGTLDQRSMSLYDVQQKYFESWYVSIGILPIPGAVPLMGLLFLNLLVGGMVRLRRTWSRAGIFVVHIGIATLLLGSLVEWVFSNKGHMTLYEGNKSESFESYFEWEVAIHEPLPGGRERIHVILGEEFLDLAGNKKAVFQPEGLPFVLELSGFVGNARPALAGQSAGVDGVVLNRLPPAKDAESNLPGLHCAVVEQDGRRHAALLWGVPDTQFVVNVAGKMYEVQLQHRRWMLPFEIELKDFRRVLHPGTQLPKSFSSDVVRYEAGSAEDIHISMNEPMVYQGYKFFQSGWGPQNAGPNARLFSTFSVVKNPANSVPEIACWIIGFGLAFHFLTRLWRHVKTEATRQAAAA